jgi:hypothetical protein
LICFKKITTPQIHQQSQPAKLAPTTPPPNNTLPISLSSLSKTSTPQPSTGGGGGGGLFSFNIQQPNLAFAINKPPLLQQQQQQQQQQQPQQPTNTTQPKVLFPQPQAPSTSENNAVKSALQSSLTQKIVDPLKTAIASSSQSNDSIAGGLKPADAQNSTTTPQPPLNLFGTTKSANNPPNVSQKENVNNSTPQQQQLKSIPTVPSDSDLKQAQNEAKTEKKDEPKPPFAGLGGVKTNLFGSSLATSGGPSSGFSFGGFGNSQSSNAFSFGTNKTFGGASQSRVFFSGFLAC